MVPKLYLSRLQKLGMNSEYFHSCSNQRENVGVVPWKNNEFQTLDREIKKLLTTYKAYRPRSDKDRLHLKREGGGRG